MNDLIGNQKTKFANGFLLCHSFGVFLLQNTSLGLKMANEMAESAEEGFSFDDSDQFDEDSMSLCSSWLSENDLVGALTWRGWKKNSATDSSDSGKNHQPGEV